MSCHAPKVRTRAAAPLPIMQAPLAQLPGPGDGLRSGEDPL